MNNNISLYIHIPFCRKRCNYCDFFHIDYDSELSDKYIKSLIKEISSYKNILSNRKLSTLYIGGGTPSVLSEKNLETLLSRLVEYVENDTEFTFEMNPESIEASKLKILKKYGVNRISIGFQSLDDSILKVFGRVHNRKTAIDSYELVRKYNFNNVSIDLIYAIKEEYQIIDTLREVISLKPEHISLYPLELVDNLKINEYLSAVEDDIYIRDFDIIYNELELNGYTRYEISNFSFKGYESKHNINYWKFGEYIGAGLSAHGYLNMVRYENTKSFNKYLKGEYLRNETPLSESDLVFEKIMLGLRLTEGFNLKDIYESLSVKQIDVIDKYLDLGLLIKRNNNLSLSKEGFHIMNKLLVELL